MRACSPFRRVLSGRTLYTTLSPRSLVRTYATDAEKSGLPASTDLLEVYRGMVASGRLRWDSEQVRCIMKLRELMDTLKDYEPPIDLQAKLSPSEPLFLGPKKGGGFQWWKKEQLDPTSRDLVKMMSAEEELAALSTPRGILLIGPPGTGKSILLSLFFDLIPTSRKRRVHYHAFTLSLYRQVHKEMQRRRDQVTEDVREANRDIASAKGWRAVFSGGRYDTEGGHERKMWKRDDTIPFVIARDMLFDYHILYFDELQLVDASSAALLRDVLSWFWRLGGVIVSCSNRFPDDLVIGSQRDRMASFLTALKDRCDVVALDGGRDWRMGVDLDDPIQRTPSWFQTEDAKFDDLWREAGGDAAQPQTLTVYGRPLPVPQAVDRACRYTFSDLCETYLGPADYLTLASTYQTFFIDEVPLLPLKAKNEARRLISLVDALYESKCQVFVRAVTSPANLFFPDAADQLNPEASDPLLAEALTETVAAAARPNVSAYTDSPTEGEEDRAEAFKALALGKLLGADELFAFKRAVSRLVEMTTSPTYPNEEWLPLAVRTWETAVSASTSAPLRSTIPSLPSEGDFAVEAAYSRPQRLTPRDEPIITHRNRGAGPREDPPVLREEHVWGVAENWGERAGKWGQGPNAFKQKKDE